MRSFFHGYRIILLKGEITEIEADAIVNAANPYLSHGGGVAWAIVRRGGEIIQRESEEYVRKYGPVPVGGVAVTSAGSLKAKYVIHAVGPRYGIEGREKLELAIRKSLEMAEKLGLRSIAFPAISTGIYGMPYDVCAETMSDVFLKFKPRSINEVMVVLFGEEAYQVFEKVFEKILPLGV
ncbi:ADP-ribose-binding protein [Metallosphaera hakonensis]|uniref:ADP-ribose-binding protein n=1 Tax=Metallosphaera hakonensis JCM 8857 = DSM 7519 TaxID=1293036 RepID=A0A2U9IR83_9CREN|nr:ADP-ribose-binding protein [Metallosphaera hakonensis]AWR98542.1 ADP-ribose-binding protein [Metallosphaera hakonensis JCM 8857 = DSM 7519]